MGKGKRARAERILDKQENPQKYVPKKHAPKWIAPVVLSVIALALVVVLCGNILISNGVFMRTTISAVSNNFEIDNTMASYFFKSSYNRYINTYKDYLSYIGLDTTVSLKKQDYDETQTWFDYFMSGTKNQMQEYLVLAEAAKVAGITLEEEDKASIDDVIASLEETASKNGYSLNQYIALSYGKGVKESDIRKSLEFVTLATKYYKQTIDGYAYNDTDFDTYYSENKNQFLFCDHISYTFTSEIPEGATPEEIEKINAATKEQADKLAATHTTEEFNALLGDKTATLKERYAYSDADELGKWAFSAGRKAGDTTVIAGTNQYTAYLMLTPEYRKEYVTKNVRHILLTGDTYGSAEAAKAKADEVLAEWQSGEKTGASFGVLAEKYSDDAGSTANGGLYENVDKGQMVDTFEKWAYDSSRKTGDAGIVESSYGYHVMYFEGDGQIAWKSAAKTAKQNADYSAFYEEQKKLYPVTFDEAKLQKIEA